MIFSKISKLGVISLFFIFILLELLSFDINAQQQTEIDTLTYNETTLEEIIKTIKQGTIVRSYESKTGEYINIGDTLKIGMPKNSLSDTYVTIQSGKLKGATKLLIGNNPIKLNTNWSGKELIVQEMYAGHLGGGKNQPIGVYLFLGNANEVELIKGLLSIQVVNIDSALEQGEIFTKKFYMSKSDAVKKLKEQKDLLDLGIISKDEFEMQKIKLTPIILRAQ
jgi:hypothetical protein